MRFDTTPSIKGRTSVTDSESQPLGSIPAIWVDVTTLLRWNRPAVGVVRVEERLAKWILDLPAESIRFCRYDRPLRAFLEVPPETVAARLAFYRKLAMEPAAAPNANAATPRKAKRKWKSKNPIKIARKIARGLLRASRPMLQRRLFIDRAFKGSFLNRTQPPLINGTAETSKPVASIFRTGDVYVSVGADWDDNDLKRLYESKQAVRLKVIGICYDTIPIKFPHLTLDEVAQIFPRYLADLAWVCDHVMCISACTRRDFLAYIQTIGAPAPDTSVIVLGNDLSQKAAGPDIDTPEHQPDSGDVEFPGVSDVVAATASSPYVLFVSTIEARKNHETLYKVWVRLVESGCDVPNLICVGMRGWGTSDLLDCISHDPRVVGRIRFLHGISDRELAYLYRRCLYTVYPSLYEGWGLPVAESLAFGKFCLCSNAGSLTEAGGTFAEYLDPWDVSAWTERIRSFAERPLEVEDRNRRAAAQFKPQSWSETSAAILEKAQRLIQHPA